MIGHDRTKLFLNKAVHVSCKGRFYNGVLVKIDSEGVFLIIDDFKLGEMPILLQDILNIEPFKEEGK